MSINKEKIGLYITIILGVILLIAASKLLGMLISYLVYSIKNY